MRDHCGPGRGGAGRIWPVRLAVALLVLTAFGALPPEAVSSPIPVWIKVFRDLDKNGAFDPDEPGLANVAVTNGQEVFLTESDGTSTTEVDPTRSRHVWLTVPSGYLVTTPFYHRVHSVPSTDSAYFGLTPLDLGGPGPFTFAQITDTHVASPQDGLELAQDLTELALCRPRPAFVVVTGDLVETGGDRDLFGYYLQAFEDFPIPVHHMYGNHDAIPDYPVPTLAYEDYLGPTYYSFEYGNCHFVALNSEDPPAAQAEWFGSDLAHMNPARRLIIMRHSPTVGVELDEFALEGAEAVLSGDWHATRLRRYGDILDINSAPLCFGGIDRTPRGFRLLVVSMMGIETEYRWSGQARRLTVVHPPPGGEVSQGVIPVRVNAYDSSAPVMGVRAVVSVPGRPQLHFDLSQESPQSWAEVWDASESPEGEYGIFVMVSDGAGRLWQKSADFTLTSNPTPTVAAGSDWPLFQRDHRHQGRADDVVEPPLALAWVVPAGGATGLSSPVVREGVVYVGTSHSDDFSQCGVSAFDAVTGESLWRHTTSASVRNTVGASAEGVFAVTVDGHLVALDTENGAERWRAALGDTSKRFETSSPVVEGGVVYAGRAPHLSAFDAGGGTRLWTADPMGMEFPPNDYPTAALAAGRVLAGNTSGLFCLHRMSGAELWGFSGVHRSPTLDGTVVYGVGDAFNHQYLYAREIVSEQLVWTSPVDLLNESSCPALADSLLVVGSGTGEVLAFAQEDGELRWSFPTGTALNAARPYVRVGPYVTSSPAVSGSTVYVGAGDGYLYALDLHTGELEWSYYFGVPVRGSPAVSGNAVYVTADDGCVYAFVTATDVSAVPEIGSEAHDGDGGRSGGLVLDLPNPLRVGDRLLLSAGSRGMGELRIVDVTGRTVRELYRGPVGREERELLWDGRDGSGEPLAPGVYFAALRGGEGLISSKFVFVK